LALEIAYRTKEKDKACSVFWVDASDIDSVHQAYASIVQKLKLPGYYDSCSLLASRQDGFGFSEL
jgi:hypothetical protein